MKKYLLFAFFCLIHIHSNSQNFQCLQAGVTHHFINGNGYLRGIRIDSTRASGSDLVFYPFKTLRGYTPGFSGAFWFTDTAGSWLGERVIMQPDGTFLFDNINNDTVVIRTQAHMGDAWIFYTDSASQYYMATVAAMDTMTVSGSLDSIKTITISAYNSGGPDPSDPINGFVMRLSKNHGFVTAFDLYTFPYRFAATPDYFYYRVTVFDPSLAHASTFDLTDFHNPTQLEIYNYHLGDRYQYTTTPNLGGFSFCLPDTAYSGVETDSIGSVTIIDPSHTGFGIAIFNEEDHLHTLSGFHNHFTATSSTTLLADTSRLLVNFTMPEEAPDKRIYYYHPADSQFCSIAPSYGIVSPGNCCPYEQWYKTGIGLTKTVTHLYGAGPCDEVLVEILTKKLTFSVRDGLICGTPLNIVSAPKAADMSVYPNPVSDMLTIDFDEPGKHIIALHDIMGAALLTGSTEQSSLTFDISKVAPGIYTLQATSAHGMRLSKKIVVMH